MTDNEIIKAEKVINELHAYCFCSQSVFKEMGYSFTETDFEYVNNLFYIINQQKAEIEKLQDELHRAKVEISKHFDYMDEAKSEAIKEFAERLKESIYVRENGFDVSNIILLTRIDNSIDNLVKEMTEVNENE